MGTVCAPSAHTVRGAQTWGWQIGVDSVREALSLAKEHGGCCGELLRRAKVMVAYRGKRGGVLQWPASTGSGHRAMHKRDRGPVDFWDVVTCGMVQKDPVLKARAPSCPLAT
jgi:hypothetical protein